MASLAVVPVAVVSWFAERFWVPILAAVALTTSITATTGNLSVQSAAAVIVACVSVAAIVRLALQARVAPPPPPATRLSIVKEPVAEGPKRLTARERQVIELAAGGLTAREIGLRLFIGERTVETHLGNAYTKLGIGSKRELIQRTLASAPGTD